MFRVDGTPEGIRIIYIHIYITIFLEFTSIPACPNAVMSSNLKRIAAGKLTLQWSSHRSGDSNLSRIAAGKASQ